MDLLKPKKTNPRGIPEAPFIEKVDAIITDPETQFKPTMAMFQDRLQQYKYMEVSKQQQLADLRFKIPDIENNLAVIRHLQQQQADGAETLTTNFELDSTLYARADVDLQSLDSVYLWLGADVMLEYPLDEALDLLNQLDTALEDLDFLRQNITTMEVNTARLYNWDVERVKGLQTMEQNTKDLNI
ncbi:Prefoldin, subunit 3 [Metschnikowia bicuspidata]|uniref:Prefoldin subunit 3 n=1 Tax=Metschnikowia bicuspidata TaxID=27322 RepID=A0A4P9ZA32_9ASCO|nr:Prefoldin, subunit 3 [Metschnikowia bicuspidata]